ncbi:MAG: hypothetical protein ACI8UZ_000253 [Akkermansiaceae bacterium]|jgi:hypothetical protein
MYGATLMHQIIMLMHVKNEVRELLDLVYIHPALNELFLTAAVAAICKVKTIKAAASIRLRDSPTPGSNQLHTRHLWHW